MLKANSFITDIQASNIYGLLQEYHRVIVMIQSSNNNKMSFETSTRRTTIIIWTFVLCQAVSSEFTTSPLNVAAVVGQSDKVILNCTSDILGANIIWMLAGSSLGPCIAGLHPLPPYEYDMPDSPGGVTCNLIITSISTSEAGLYTCTQSIPTEEATAQLIVLDTEPACSSNTEVDVSQTATLSCSVKYTGVNGPVMTWYDPNNQQVTSDNSGSGSLVNYTTSVTPYIPTVDPYMCKTEFKGATANNPPSYTSSCRTKTINVIYAPFKDNFTITPSTDSDLAIDTVLTCNAVAYPEISNYQWTDPNGTVTTGQKVSLSQVGQNLTYNCTAGNTLGSTTLSVTVTVVPGPSTTTSLSTSSSGGVSGGPTTANGSGTGSNTALIVGLCVGIPLGILAIVLFVCFCNSSCPLNKECYNRNGPKKDALSRSREAGFCSIDHSSGEQTTSETNACYADLSVHPSATDNHFYQPLEINTMAIETQSENLPHAYCNIPITGQVSILGQSPAYENIERGNNRSQIITSNYETLSRRESDDDTAKYENIQCSVIS